MTKKSSKERYGWRGKILHVDLSESRIWEEELPVKLMADYIGGSGINARLLYDLVRKNPHVEPLSPENPLIFGFGSVVGTAFPCATRFTVTAKSPLTGIFGDSNAGGFFGVRVKQAGYDHIVIRGKSSRPAALLIENGSLPKLIDASNLWGLDTYETDEKIRKDFGMCESARIGPAGENLVKYANIFSGSKRVSANGRAGMGCIMGSKKLKAIIVKSDGIVPVSDKIKLDALNKRYRDLWGSGPGTAANSEYGTLLLIAQIGKEVGTRNDQEKISPEQLERYDLEKFTTRYKDGKSSCHLCPVGCSQKWKVEDGPYKGERGDKIEFGHYINLGPLLGIFDYPSLFHLSDLTNRMGMDCTQFGWNLSMMMECFQRGILSSRETDGMELKWGDTALVSEMIMKVTKREGLGNLLAESIPEIIRKTGPDVKPYGFHTKGMTFPYNRKEVLPMSLASSVASRGADHMKGHPFSALVGSREMLERIFGNKIPPEITDNKSPVAKGRVVWWHENYKMLMDSLGLCFIPVAGTTIFGDPLIMFEEMGEIYQAVTGKDPGALFNSAERAYQVEKSFNALLGINRKDDVRQGTKRGQVDPINHPGMLDEYYHYRGCSNEGLPGRKRLEEVGLIDVAEDLAEKGVLSDHESPAIHELIITGGSRDENKQNY
jgi:aldehyde:ferredoxin oxidoreductase